MSDPMDRLKVPEMMRLLGYQDPRAVHRLLLSGEIVGMKPGRDWSAYRKDVLAYIDRETAKQVERTARTRRRGRRAA